MLHSKPHLLDARPTLVGLLPCRLPCRPAKTRLLRPQPLAHQRQSITEGRMRLLVPCRPSHGVGHPLLLLVGEERNQREEPQQRRGNPPDRPLRPMSLRLKAQALTHLLKGALHLPAPHKPRDDLPRFGISVGAQ